VEEAEENLGLDWVEEGKFGLIQLLELGVVKCSDSHRPERQEFRVRVVFCGYSNLSKIDLHEEVEVVPSIGNQLARIVVAFSDAVLTGWDCVGQEESDLNAVFVLHACALLMHSFDIFLLQLEELLMENLSLVIHD